jgi:2-polyprenyl-3-methyl-5-hydroxy-6-metoxy-1,4-benzoquinol methylase
VPRRVMRRLRAAYYRTGYGRRFPFKARVEAGLRAWEAADGRGDVPKDKDGWERQYESGVWSYLGEIGELSHYSVIVGYAAYLRPGARVLDVGCGHGVLHERWLAKGYRRYVGIDISEVAVGRLREREIADAEFVAADAETFEPGETFDVVVFNESITYFKDPVAGFARYVQALAPGGIVIVSCHQQSERAQAILRTLERTWRVLDTTEVRQGDNSWRCVVFEPLT